MKKSEFITQVAESAGVKRTEADKVIATALTVIADALKAGDKVALTGFGTFEVRARAARTGLNIRTREKISIPASKRPTFSPGAVLRAAVAEKKGAKKKPAAKTSPASKTAAKKPAAKK